MTWLSGSTKPDKDFLKNKKLKRWCLKGSKLKPKWGKHGSTNSVFNWREIWRIQGEKSNFRKLKKLRMKEGKGNRSKMKYINQNSWKKKSKFKKRKLWKNSKRNTISICCNFSNTPGFNLKITTWPGLIAASERKEKLTKFWEVFRNRNKLCSNKPNCPNKYTYRQNKNWEMPNFQAMQAGRQKLQGREIDLKDKFQKPIKNEPKFWFRFECMKIGKLS